MKGTWVLWIGLTMLSASICAGMEEYAEPAANEGSPEDVTYAVTNSNPQDNHEVTDSAPFGDYEAGDPGIDEVITLIGEGEYAVIDQGLERDHQMVTVAPADNRGAMNSMTDAVQQMLAAGPDVGHVSTLASAQTEFVASLGVSELPSEGSTSPINTRLNWDTMPELAQVRAGVGLEMATQIAAYTGGMLNLHDITGRLDNVISQISLGAGDAFGAIPIPGIAGLLANQ